MYKKPKCSSLDELKVLVEKVKEKADEEFEKLISDFSINTEKNKELASNYYSLVDECRKLEKSIKRLKVWRWILLIPLIFPFFLMSSSLKKKIPIFEQKKVEKDKTQLELHKQLEQFSENLSYEFAFNKIINKVWDDIEINSMLEGKESQNWEYDYPAYMNETSCATALVSGRLFEHPFIYMNRKSQGWHTHVYTGSVPVTYSVNINGRHETHTQIVTATVPLPEPHWNTTPVFLYKTSKPLNLEFSNDINKKQLKKAIKKATYQAMENSEFDKLFPANRNNEIEYRVVFTPAAQEGMVNLLKNQQYTIFKAKENTLISAGLNPLDNDFSDDFNYDLQAWKTKFVNWIERLVTQLGTYSLPIANMPVYYQMRYNDHSKHSNISRLQIQENIAWLFDYVGAYSNYETDVIFEPTKVTKKEVGGINFNCVEVIVHYFHPRDRIQYETRPSARGPVVVPVHVVDYLPRQAKSYLYQSINFKANQKEVYGKGWCIHCGKLIFVDYSPTPPKDLVKSIQSLTSK